MKKIKLLSAISTISAVAPALLVLTQCSKPKQFTDIIVELSQSSFMINETCTYKDIKVYKSLEGDKGDKIEWSDGDLKLFDNDGQDITDDFKTNGIKSDVITTLNFTVKYNNFSKSLSIEFTKIMYTLNCSVRSDLFTISKNIFKVDENKTWADVKPTITPAKDIDPDAFTIWWIYRSGSHKSKEVQDSDVISESCEIELNYIFKGTAEYQTAIACDTKGTKSLYGYDCFIPSTTPVDAKSDQVHRFTFTPSLLPSNKTFKYFWIVLKTETSARLLNIYGYAVEEVKYNNEDIGYKVTNDQYGRYITFDRTFTNADTGTIEIDYRPTSATTIQVIPVFEVD